MLVVGNCICVLDETSRAVQCWIIWFRCIWTKHTSEILHCAAGISRLQNARYNSVCYIFWGFYCLLWIASSIKHSEGRCSFRTKQMACGDATRFRGCWFADTCRSSQWAHHKGQEVQRTGKLLFMNNVLFRTYHMCSGGRERDSPRMDSAERKDYCSPGSPSSVYGCSARKALKFSRCGCRRISKYSATTWLASCNSTIERRLHAVASNIVFPNWCLLYLWCIIECWWCFACDM